MGKYNQSLILFVSALTATVCCTGFASAQTFVVHLVDVQNANSKVAWIATESIRPQLPGARVSAGPFAGPGDFACIVTQRFTKLEDDRNRLEMRLQVNYLGKVLFVDHFTGLGEGRRRLSNAGYKTLFDSFAGNVASGRYHALLSGPIDDPNDNDPGPPSNPASQSLGCTMRFVRSTLVVDRVPANSIARQFEMTTGDIVLGPSAQPFRSIGSLDDFILKGTVFDRSRDLHVLRDGRAFRAQFSVRGNMVTVLSPLRPIVSEPAPGSIVAMPEIGVQFIVQRDGLTVHTVSGGSFGSFMELRPGDRPTNEWKLPFQSLESVREYFSGVPENVVQSLGVFRSNMYLVGQFARLGSRYSVRSPVRPPGSLPPGQTVAFPLLNCRLTISSEGLIIAGLEPGGVGARLGLQVGDRWSDAAGRPMLSINQLNDQLLRGPEGVNIPVDIVRNSDIWQGELIRRRSAITVATSLRKLVGSGNTVVQIPELGCQGSVTSLGIQISQVPPNSIAAQFGMRPGDVVTRIDRSIIRSMQQLRYSLVAGIENSQRQIYVRRGRRTLVGAFSFTRGTMFVSKRLENDDDAD